MAATHQHRYRKSTSKKLLADLTAAIPLPPDVTALAVFRCSDCGHLDRLSMASEVSLNWQPALHRRIVKYLQRQSN